MLTVSLIIAAVMAALPLADGHEYPDGVSSGHVGGEYASSEYFYEDYLYGDPVPFKNMPSATPMSNDYNLHANVMASVDYRHWPVSEKLGECQCQQSCNSCGSDNAPVSPPEECDCDYCSGCDDKPTPPDEVVEPIDLEALRQEIKRLRQEIEELRQKIAKETVKDLREMLEEELESTKQFLKQRELELEMEKRRRAMPDPPHVPASECTCGCLEPDSSPSGSGSTSTCECENEYKWPTYAWASAWATVYFTQDTSPTQEFNESIPMEVAAEAWALGTTDKAEYARETHSGNTEHPLTHDAPMKSEQQEQEDENGMLTTPRWVFSDTVRLSAGAYVIKDLVHTQSGCEPRLEEGQIPEEWEFHDQGGKALGSVSDIPNVYESDADGGMKPLKAESVAWTFGGRAP